jgi:hypothetical protein
MMDNNTKGGERKRTAEALALGRVGGKLRAFGDTMRQLVVVWDSANDTRESNSVEQILAGELVPAQHCVGVIRFAYAFTEFFVFA